MQERSFQIMKFTPRSTAIKKKILSPYYWKTSRSILPTSQCPSVKHIKHSNSPWLLLIKSFRHQGLVESCWQSVGVVVGGQDYCLHLQMKTLRLREQQWLCQEVAVSAQCNLFSVPRGQSLRWSHLPSTPPLATISIGPLSPSPSY